MSPRMPETYQLNLFKILWKIDVPADPGKSRFKIESKKPGSYFSY